MEEGASKNKYIYILCMIIYNNMIKHLEIIKKLKIKSKMNTINPPISARGAYQNFKVSRGPLFV